MGASPTPPAAKRFAPYVDELQEFFASACLRYGSPEDIIAMTERLESSPSFAEDFGSMIRSIVLREGGELPHSQVLEVLAIAVGGPRMDQAPQLYAQPMRNLLSFISVVLRKPWNEPPPEIVTAERAHVLPFPTRPRAHAEPRHSQASAIAAATDAAAAERTRHPNPMPNGAPVKSEFVRPAAPTAAPSTSDHPSVPDPVGVPTPAPSSAQDPETPTHEAVKDPEFDRPGSPAQQTASHSIQTAAADPSPPRQAPEPSDAPAAPSHAARAEPPQPGLQPAAAAAAAAPGVPTWQLAAKAVRAEGAEPQGAVAAQVPVPPAISRSATASAHPATDVAPKATPRATPTPTPSPRTSPLPGPASSAPAAAAARLQFAPHLPRTAAGMLVTGAMLLVLAGVIAASLHSNPTALVGKQAIAPNSSTTADATHASSATSSKPSAAGQPATSLALSARSARVSSRRLSDDDDESGVAPPYSIPIPRQPAASTGSPAQVLAKPSASAQASTPQAAPPRPPGNEIASDGGAAVPAAASASRSYAPEPLSSQPEVRTERAASRDPDAAIVGDLPRTARGFRSIVADRPGYLDISSGIMAGNLISAPMPDYPRLAHFAHVSGEVVLQAVIAKNGSVLATHVLRGNRLLRGAAEDAVRQWRYRPYVVDGHPVEVSTVVTVRFHNDK